MKYIDYQEKKTQGSFNFPIAYYHQTPYSPRYDMQYHWHTQYEYFFCRTKTRHRASVETGAFLLRERQQWNDRSGKNFKKNRNCNAAVD